MPRDASPPSKKSPLASLIDALPGDLRDLVRERAAIIAEACHVSWEEAEERAYVQETGRAMPGPARGKERGKAEGKSIEDAEAAPSSKKAGRAGS